MVNLNIQFPDILQSDIVHRSIIIAVAMIAILLLVAILKRTISNRVKDPDNKYRARKASSALGYIMVVLVALLVFSDKLGDIGIALGLAGAGIAFALQEVIIAFVGWIYIILTGAIKIGQRVEIDGMRGDIIDIGVMKTTIMEIGEWVKGDLYNGRITALSNGFVFRSPIKNYSGDFPFLWDEITVPIKTGSDFILAKKIFTEVTTEVCGDYAERSQKKWNEMTNKYLIEDAMLKPMVSLSFDHNWITFTIRYVVDYKLRRSNKDKIYARILEEIAKHDDVVIIGTSTLEVTTLVKGEQPSSMYS